MLKLELINKRQLDEMSKIEALYLTAFPKEERAPIDALRRSIAKKKAEMLMATDEGEFIGFVYMICDKKLAYIGYLAIDDSKRRQGYGSEVLTALKERYSDKKLFLAREQLEEDAPNYQERLNRVAFYEKNEFVTWPFKIREAKVIYNAMGIGEMITAKEYHKLMCKWCGWRSVRKNGMKVLE